jgi:hypothetical protein
VFQDGTEQRLVESLSLIDAVMPDVVASRQNQQNQQKQQIVKNEMQDTNGEEGNTFKCNFMFSILITVFKQMKLIAVFQQ